MKLLKTLMPLALLAMACSGCSTSGNIDLASLSITQPLAVDYAKIRCPKRPGSWQTEAGVTVVIPDPDTVDADGKPALSARATMKLIDESLEAIERKNRVIRRQGAAYEECRNGAPQPTS